MTLICQIHRVEFSLKAPPDATDEIREACTWQQCPLCQRNDFSKLRDEAARLREQNAALLRAIEIKQQFLVTEIPQGKA